ncbi:MAG: FAD-dependent oxidoreductase [Myxococcota bacterium]|jgi:NADPH-dependent 2,4-dienoyl-CoA reductase/sulfur reductase-like enzyme/rhodanese-related sulfurtransferase/two-component sensor histidine kinase|nr:FAD-dependent oxidoreductase [Myxococcota bacterium]
MASKSDPSQTTAPSQQAAAEHAQPDPLQFAAILAHQIKSPVAAVSTLLNVLVAAEDKNLSPAQRDLLWRAEARCAEAVATVERMMAIIRPGGDDASTDAVSLCRRLAPSFRNDATAAQLRFDLELDTESCWAAIREEALIEIIRSLVSNAIKYTPAHGRIALRLAARDAVLELFVEDSGIGVPKEQRTQIFEAFFRANTATGSKRSGIGLGLFFVKTLVERAAGEIQVERSSLGGAAFCVRLPLALDHRSTNASSTGQLKVVIVGGAAAGPKVASRICRLSPNAHVTVIEKGRFLAYAGCGLPYYVSGVVAHQDELMSTTAGALRDPIFFQHVKNVVVRNRSEAKQLDCAQRRVLVRELDSTEEFWLDYDKLVLATGALPIEPKSPNVELAGIYRLHGMEDAEGIRRALVHARALDVVVVGGGLIGVEITEALVEKGCRVTIVERRQQLLAMLDWEMAKLVERKLLMRGVKVLCDTEVTGFEGQQQLEQVLTSRGPLRAEMAILGLGVRPNTQLAHEAGLALGEHGGILVDDSLLSSDPDIYAIGDCIESHHLILEHKQLMPMGSTANRQGRVAANNICGHPERYPGSIGSTVCRVFECCVARTGLSEREALESGREVLSAITSGPDRAHYLPDSKTIFVKLVVDAQSHRILGAQCIGAGQADKRADVAATAITLGCRVEDLSNLDLCYAPPYSEALDNLITTANVVRNKMDGMLRSISARELHEALSRKDEISLIDVRTPAEFDEMRLSASINIPLGALRGRLQELPKETALVVLCNSGLRSYEGSIVLTAAGFNDVRVLDGGLLAYPFELVLATGRAL